MNGEILSAQSSAHATQVAQFTLLERIRNLEKQVAELEAWDAEAQKYQLTKPSPHTDVLAYVLKPNSGSSEPPHYLCANCYEERHKSILQQEFSQSRVLVRS